MRKNASPQSKCRHRATAAMPAGGKGGTLVLKMETRSGSDRQPQKGSVRRLALIPSLLWVLYRPCQLGSLPNMEVAPIRHKRLYHIRAVGGNPKESSVVPRPCGQTARLSTGSTGTDPMRNPAPKLRLHKQLASRKEFHRAEGEPPAMGGHPRCCASWCSWESTSPFARTAPQDADRRVNSVKSRGLQTTGKAS